MGTQKEDVLLRSQCEKLHVKKRDVGKILDPLEGMVYQAMQDAWKQRELAKAEIQRALFFLNSFIFVKVNDHVYSNMGAFGILTDSGTVTGGLAPV